MSKMRLSVTGVLACLLGISFAGVAAGGQNVWTSHGPEGGNIAALAIDPQTPATLYAGTVGKGVFKSTNGGGSWSAINTGLTDTFVRTLAVDPQTPSTLYAGTFGGAFKSTTGGASWNAVNNRLTNTSEGALAVEPH